jgi:hypothetical protein
MLRQPQLRIDRPEAGESLRHDYKGWEWLSTANSSHMNTLLPILQLSLGRYYIYHLFPTSTKSLALRG